MGMEPAAYSLCGLLLCMCITEALSNYVESMAGKPGMQAIHIASTASISQLIQVTISMIYIERRRGMQLTKLV